jgi:hypothetical protein
VIPGYKKLSPAIAGLKTFISYYFLKSLAFSSGDNHGIVGISVGFLVDVIILSISSCNSQTLKGFSINQLAPSLSHSRRTCESVCPETIIIGTLIFSIDLKCSTISSPFPSQRLISIKKRSASNFDSCKKECRELYTSTVSHFFSKDFLT